MALSGDVTGKRKEQGDSEEKSDVASHGDETVREGASDPNLSVCKML